MVRRKSINIAIIYESKTGNTKAIDILGWFYCQGKMPSSIRNRYESMLIKN